MNARAFASPPRTQANYRDYGPEHARRLNFIRRARDLGFSMTRIRELLELADDRSRACHAVDTLARAHLGEVNRKIADLEALRRELRRMLENCEQGTVGTCLVIEALAEGLKRERDMDLSLAALAEIAGCFAFWAWFRMDRSAWWLLPEYWRSCCSPISLLALRRMLQGEPSPPMAASISPRRLAGSGSSKIHSRIAGIC